MVYYVRFLHYITIQLGGNHMSGILKKITASVVTMCMLFSIMTYTFATPSDAEGHWAVSEIDKWIALQLIQGNEDGKFKPDDSITRAEFITFVNRVFNFVEKAETPFPDVIKDAWYSDDMSKAFSAGIAKGDDQGDLRPDALLTREEAAVILSRVFSLSVKDTNAVNKFSDTDKISAWSKDALNAMAGMNYISGREGNKLAPLDNITRAETVKMIDNVMGQLFNKAGTYSNNAKGNLVVNTRDVILKDTVIEGDLYLTQGIGDGNVVLDNVKVKGKTFVQGGGENSILVINSTLSGNMVVAKKDGKIRIVARGNTEIAAVQLNSGAKLEEDNITGKGFTNVEILHRYIIGHEIMLKGDFLNVLLNSTNAKVQIIDGKVDKLEVAKGADNSEIILSQKAIVNLASINAPVNITGSSAIQKAEVGSDNVKMDQKPVNITVMPGISQPMVGGTPLPIPAPTPTPAPAGGGGAPFFPSVPSNPTPNPTTGLLQLDTINVNGDIITVKYNEEIDGSSVPAPQDFIVKDKKYYNMSYLTDLSVTNVSISGQSLILKLEKPLGSNDIVEISYVQGQNPIRDVLTKRKVSQISNARAKLSTDLTIKAFGVDGISPLAGVTVKIVNTFSNTVMATGVTNENGLLELKDFNIPYISNQDQIYIIVQNFIDLEYSKSGYETRYLKGVSLVCGVDQTVARSIPTLVDVTNAVYDTRNSSLINMRDIIETNANALDFDMRVGSDYYLINDKDTVAESIYKKASTLYDKVSIQAAFIDAVRIEASLEPLSYKEVYIDDDKDSVVLFFNKRINTNSLTNTQTKNAISLSSNGKDFSTLGAGDAVVSTSGAIELKLGVPLNGNLNKFRINPNTVKDFFGNILTSYSETGFINSENRGVLNADNSGVIGIKQGTLGSKTVTLKLRIKNAFGTLLVGAHASDFVVNINNGAAVNFATQPFSNFVDLGNGYYTVDFIGAAEGTAYHLSISAQGIVIEPDITIVIPKETATLMAYPGLDKVTYKTFNVSLDGSGSIVPAGKSIKYNWSIIGKPGGSTASLMNSTTVNPNFIPDIAGDYVVGLTVNDGTSSSDLKTINIKVKNFGDTTDSLDSSIIGTGKSLSGTGYDISDMIPLTDGWVIVKDPNNKKVVFLNVLTGEIAKEYAFTDTPKKMEFDFERDILYVSMSNINTIAKVNVNSGNISYISINGTATEITLGEKGILFALSYPSTFSRTIQVIDTETAKVAYTADAGSENYAFMVYDKQGNNLFLGEEGISPSSLASFKFYEDTFKLKQVQFVWDMGSNGLDLAISEDGKHVAFSCGGGNGAGYTIFDINSSDITQKFGEWNTDAYPTAATFTLDNKYMVASNGFEIKIFDVDSHSLVNKFSRTTGIDYDKVRISRGGKIIYDYISSGLNIYQSNIPQLPVSEPEPANKPIAVTAGDKITYEGFKVGLDASLSRMGNGTALTYKWSIVSKPVTSKTVLQDVYTPQPYFIPDSIGDYIISLKINNGIMDSDERLINVKVKSMDSTTDDINFSTIDGAFSNYVQGYTVNKPVPLTDGWLITADATNKIKIINVITGDVGKEYQVSAAPNSIDFDFEHRTIIASLASANKVVKIDITNDTVTYIDTPYSYTGIVSGKNNIAFAITNGYVSVIDYVYNNIVGSYPISVYGNGLLAYDKNSNNLFIAQEGSSMLFRYSYNEITHVLIKEQGVLFGSNGLDLTISNDGQHIAFCQGGGNGNGYSIFDIKSSDITQKNGEWITGAYPTAAAFTLGNKYIIVSNGDALFLYDVVNHYQVATLKNPDNSSSHDKVAISKGGKIVFDIIGDKIEFYKSTLTSN